MPKAIVPVPCPSNYAHSEAKAQIHQRKVVLTREIVSIHFFGKLSSSQVTQRRAPRGFQTINSQRPGCERVQAFSDHRDTPRAIAVKHGAASTDAPLHEHQSAALVERLYLLGAGMR